MKVIFCVFCLILLILIVFENFFNFFNLFFINLWCGWVIVGIMIYFCIFFLYLNNIFFCCFFFIIDWEWVIFVVRCKIIGVLNFLFILKLILIKLIYFWLLDGFNIGILVVFVIFLVFCLFWDECMFGLFVIVIKSLVFIFV